MDCLRTLAASIIRRTEYRHQLPLGEKFVAIFDHLPNIRPFSTGNLLVLGGPRQNLPDALER